jgi:leucyl-tRNA synthetase
MTAPLAPHISEEMWARLGHPESLARGPFPEADPALLVAEQVEYPIQVKGKVRARIIADVTAVTSDLEAAALAEPRIVELLAGATPRKVVVVPGKMISIVP